jgi:hypothetical protein
MRISYNYILNSKATVRAYFLIIVITLISCNDLSFSRKDKFKSLEGTKWVLDFEAINKGYRNDYFEDGMNGRVLEFITEDRIIVYDLFQNKDTKMRYISYNFEKKEQSGQFYSLEAKYPSPTSTEPSFVELTKMNPRRFFNVYKKSGIIEVLSNPNNIIYRIKR